MPNMDSPTKEPSSSATDVAAQNRANADKPAIPEPRSWGVASNSIEQPEPPSESAAKTSKNVTGTPKSAERVSHEADAAPSFGTSVIAADSPDSGVSPGVRPTPRPTAPTPPAGHRKRRGAATAAAVTTTSAKTPAPA